MATSAPEPVVAARTTKSERARVVIVGAGFGGLELAKALRRAPVDVLLIDRNNYHTFQPLLYQVATAALESDEIAETVRGILRSQANFSFRLGTVTGVDADARKVILDDAAQIAYDYLVLATGASTNTFGVPGVEEHAFELKSLEDAIVLRNHVIRQFELANADPRIVDKGALNFVAVGGGPTGVETAGALTELFAHVFRKDFEALDVDKANVILVEAMDHVLSPFAPRLRDYTLKTLQRKGVDVRLGHTVRRIRTGEVTIADGDGNESSIKTKTVIWSAGVRASALADGLGFEQTRGGRIVVSPDLSVPDHLHVFVIGDLSGSRDEDGSLHPQLAPVAIQGGRHVAKNIRRLLNGEETRPFRYRDQGIMATIGRNAAVAQFGGGFKLRGWFAWVAWVFVHLMQIVGLRNKLYVYANWVYNYLTYDRRARLLLEVPARGLRAEAGTNDGSDSAQQRNDRSHDSSEPSPAGLS